MTWSASGDHRSRRDESRGTAARVVAWGCQLITAAVMAVGLVVEPASTVRSISEMTAPWRL